VDIGMDGYHMQSLYDVVTDDITLKGASNPFLKMKHNTWMIFDPIYPLFVYEEQFKSNADWKLLYGDMKEVILPDSPQSCGKEVVIQHYVNADHDSEQITHQSAPALDILHF
jgi:hypothetical protein